MRAARAAGRRRRAEWRRRRLTVRSRAHATRSMALLQLIPILRDYCAHSVTAGASSIPSSSGQSKSMAQRQRRIQRHASFLLTRCLFARCACRSAVLATRISPCARIHSTLFLPWSCHCIVRVAAAIRADREEPAEKPPNGHFLIFFSFFFSFSLLQRHWRTRDDTNFTCHTAVHFAIA